MMQSRLRWAQWWMSIGLLAFLIATVAALDLLAHNQALAGLLMRLDQQVNRIDKQRYSYEHYFPDFEDRLVYEELPSANYSKGGVYLIGTSNLKWATRFWDLPQEQRSLIHNYGIGASDHLQQFQLIRHLVEHENVLAAGGDKNMVILGTSYHSTGDGSHDPNRFFASIWRRHGLYEYQASTGIAPVATSSIWPAVEIERVRIAGCVKSILYSAARQLGYHARVRMHDTDAYNRERTEWIGGNWKETMRDQVSQFEAMTDYLQRRGVRLVVVFLPLGTWEDKLPFERAYIESMTEVCRKKSVPTMDWSKLLDDEDFADSNHPNLYGVDKMQPKFLEIAIPFLRSSGALGDPSHF
jgi:hypothetical protein